MISFHEMIKKIINTVNKNIDKIKESVNKNKYEITQKILGIIILSSLLFIIYNYVPFLSIPKDIIERNLGYFYTSQLLSSIIITSFIISIIFYLISVLHVLFGKKLNLWIWGTILLMIFLFYIGFITIDREIGIKDISLVLRDEDYEMKVVGDIKCTDNDKILLIDDTISCSISPELKNITAKISFYFKDGKFKEEPINDLYFVAPKDVERICFEVKGIDSNNKKRNLSVCNPYSFLTKEEYIQNRKDFITYVLALFGIIFLSVPNVAVNIKKLSKTNNKKIDR